MKKLWNMKVTIIPIVIGAFGTVTKRIIKGTGGLGSWRTSGDHPNDSIIENGQSTEKSPGNLRRLAVTQTSMKDNQLILFTNPSARAGYDTRSIFKQSLTCLNSEFSFTKAEEPSLSYYLPIAGGRRIGFLPFPRVLVLCEM